MKSLIFLVVLIAIPAALSLKCYACSNCEDENGDEDTCSSGYNRCLKGYLKVNGEEATLVERGCTNQYNCDVGKSTCHNLKKIFSDVECKAACCDSDLCNSGAAPNFNVLLVSLCSLFAVVSVFK